MRVLMVQTYHYYRGGDSTCMFNLAGLLESRGHEVIHFAMNHPQNLPSPWSNYFTSEIDFPALLGDSSARAAISVITKSIYNREARRRIARLADDTKPDIAHFHNIHGHLTTSIVAPLRRRGIPIAWTLHDYRLVCPNTTFLRGDEICERCLPRKYWNVVLGRCKKGSLPASVVAMMSTIYDRVSRVPARTGRFITPSEFLKGKLIEGGISHEKITVIPNFVDVQSFRADAFRTGASPRGTDSHELYLPGLGPPGAVSSGADDNYYLYFGRLSREKGIDLLIDAVSGVRGGRLKVAGEGPLERELKEHAAASGADVEFLGFRTGAELRALLENAMFVVVPSRWYENLPFSVMESLAAGRPVIAADIGGIPEMVEDKVNGMLFPPGDAEALRCRITTMLGDAGMRRRMSKAGREKAERLYGPDAHYAKVMEVYGELLGRRA